MSNTPKITKAGLAPGFAELFNTPTKITLNKGK